MDIKLRTENVIIVGGATGIGYAVAQQLLYDGVKNVVIASRNMEKMQKACSELLHTDGQKIFCVQFDISNCKTHECLLEESSKLMGKTPDGLVISSGVNFDGSNWKGFNVSEEDWDRVMNINLKGVFFMMRTFSNYLFERQIKGNVCIISSISAHRDLLSVYQITKNAISGIVHAYGKHLCERGIILNCVEPGTTNTDMMRGLKEYTDGIRPGKPWNDNSIRRLIRPEEIAKVVSFCMSEAGEVLSGSCVLAGGGCKSIAR